MDVLKLHLQSHKTQIRSCVDSILKLTSNPNKTDEKDLSASLLRKRDQFVSLLSSLSLLHNQALSVDEFFSKAIQEVCSNSNINSDHVSASSLLGSEQDARFLLNFATSADEIAKQAIAEIRPHLLFFLPSSSIANKIIEITDGNDNTNNVADAMVGKQNDALSTIWENLLLEFGNRLTSSCIVSPILKKHARSINSNNDSTSSSSSSMILQMCILEKVLLIVDDKFPRRSIVSTFFSVAIRRSLYQETALVLFSSFMMENGELESSRFATTIMPSIFASSNNATPRARNEVISRFLELISNSQESLTDPVRTCAKFANLYSVLCSKNKNDGSGTNHEDDHDEEDEEEEQQNEDEVKNWCRDFLFISPLKKCLLSRNAIEFLILGVLPSFSCNSNPKMMHDLLSSIFEQVCSLWAHQQQHNNSSNYSSDGFANPSSFLHSTTSESSWSLVSTLMALLTLGNNLISSSRKDDDDDGGKESHDSFLKQVVSLLIFQSTASILKGISFRLSALNRLYQKQGALVASLYFQVSELQLKEMNLSKPKRNDETEPTTSSSMKPKFDQFPNLLEDYVNGEEKTVWSIVGEVMSSEVDKNDKQISSSISIEQTSIHVSEKVSERHRTVKLSSNNNSNSDGANTQQNVINSSGKYWFLNKRIPTETGKTSNNNEKITLIHPQLHLKSNPTMVKVLHRRFGIDCEKLNAAHDAIIQREVEFANHTVEIERLREEQESSKIKNSSSAAIASSLSSSKLQNRLASATSTLRELETKLTQAETNAAGSANHLNSQQQPGGPDAEKSDANPQDLGEEAMKELPIALERQFTAKNTTASSSTAFTRAHATDATVLVRLFLLSIASTFASVRGECAVAAASSAAWCFALAPGNILLECQKLLNGADFSMTHKLRVFNAIQVGMARLAHTRVSSQSLPKNIDSQPEFTSNSNVVYPPLPNSKQPFLNSSSTSPMNNQSEGTVRWKSRKLSQEYLQREMDRNSAANHSVRNEAIPWARHAVEVALFLTPSNQRNYGNTKTGLFSTMMFSKNGEGNNNNDDEEDEADKEFKMKIPGANDDHNKQKKCKRIASIPVIPYYKNLIERDPEGGLILEAIRTVSLISEFVARTSVMMMESMASVSLECLFTLATAHYLPSVRINALICLSGLLRFGQTRRAILFSASGSSSSSSGLLLQWAEKLTTALFLSGIARLAKEDPDSSVRFLAKDFGDMLMMP